MMFVVTLMLAVTSAFGAPVTMTNHWNGGFQGVIHLSPHHALHGWRAHITFSKPVDKLEIWRADVVSSTNGNKEYIVQNKDFDADLNVGSTLDVDFVARAPGDDVPTATVCIEGDDCSGGSSGSGTGTGTGTGSGTDTGTGSGTGSGSGTATQAPAGPVSGGGSGSSGGSSSASCGSPVQTKYDYGQALGLSILFFDAQRSGKLPANNPVPWRHDSALGDGSDVGQDLTGGWYDAGDNVKFNFPMASSTTILAWGLTKWKDAYQAAGQLDQMYDMIKWPLDYFLKCWKPKQNVLYGQVGNGAADHADWVRPEDMHMNRPSYKVDANNPGSDLAGETAASFAAGSIAFKDRDPSYAAKLLSAAKSVYAFGKDHKGIYSKTGITDAQSYYGSTGYNDELCEGAAWLYKATKDPQYLNDAKGFYQAGVGWALSWDDKNVACQLLLYEITKESKYQSDVDGFVKAYMDGGSVAHTPCGLAWRDQWGSLRYASNAAFVALMATEVGMGNDQYKTFALSQLNYVLGDNKQHMSFEIGFGNNFPRQPHHRSSSCGNTCGWDAFNSGGANPHILKGALVGGPDQGDNYSDSRKDYTKNEVTCDYNAGFQSALAGLVHFAHNCNLPASPPAKC